MSVGICYAPSPVTEPEWGTQYLPLKTPQLPRETDRQADCSVQRTRTTMEGLTGSPDDLIPDEGTDRGLGSDP